MDLPLTIKRSARRRTVALRVARGEVTVLAPPGVAEAELLRFVQAKRPWIEHHLQQFEARIPPAYRFTEGEALPFQGRTLTLRLDPGRRAAERRGDDLHVPAGSPQQVRAAVERWYAAETLRLLTPLAAQLAARLNRPLRAVRLTNARTRWGSCTAGGILRLNWRVLLGPPEVAHYLVAHEVAHLRELNHSARFWRTVGQLMPEYAAARERLRDEGWRYTLGE